MNKGVEELVEWVARQLPTGASPLVSKNWDKIGAASKEVWRAKAKQIISHPNLALIDREKTKVPPPFPKRKLSRSERDGAISAIHTLYVEEGYRPIIPLAEALKEVKECTLNSREQWPYCRIHTTPFRTSA